MQTSVISTKNFEEKEQLFFSEKAIKILNGEKTINRHLLAKSISNFILEPTGDILDKIKLLNFYIVFLNFVRSKFTKDDSNFVHLLIDNIIIKFKTEDKDKPIDNLTLKEFVESLKDINEILYNIFQLFYETTLDKKFSYLYESLVESMSSNYNYNEICDKVYSLFLREFSGILFLNFLAKYSIEYYNVKGKLVILMDAEDEVYLNKNLFNENVKGYITYSNIYLKWMLIYFEYDSLIYFDKKEDISELLLDIIQ